MGIETLVAASLASTVIGGLGQASGQRQAAAAQAQAAQYQAQVAENNSVLAREQAQKVRAQGYEAAQEQGRKTSQRVGAQRAALAAAGVDVNEGTAADVQLSTQELGRIDALRIYDNAMQQAFGYDVQGVNYKNEATLTRKKGAYAKEAGSIAATTSLISTAGNFSSKWMGFQRTGAVPSFGDF